MIFNNNNFVSDISLLSEVKSRRDGTKPLPPSPLSAREGEKSRRDGILLTVGFNLRTRNDIHSPQSPAGTTQWIVKMSSLFLQTESRSISVD